MLEKGGEEARGRERIQLNQKLTRSNISLIIRYRIMYKVGPSSKPSNLYPNISKDIKNLYLLLAYNDFTSMRDGLISA